MRKHASLPETSQERIENAIDAAYDAMTPTDKMEIDQRAKRLANNTGIGVVTARRYIGWLMMCYARDCQRRQ